MRFLADESCDFAAVRALRTIGHDVAAVVEVSPGADDEHVLAIASAESRVLLSSSQTAGVLLIRFPATARGKLGQAVVDVVSELGDRLSATFVVVEPGRARISRRPTDQA